MELFRLAINIEGSVLEKDKIALEELTPAMRAPFLGPFNGGAGEAQIPLGEGKVAILSWDGTPNGTARGSLAIDDVACWELVLAAGRDAAADGELLAAAGQEWGDDAPGVALFTELASIDQRPLLIARQVGDGWPASLAGADVLLAAVYLDATGAASLD